MAAATPPPPRRPAAQQPTGPIDGLPCTTAHPAALLGHELRTPLNAIVGFCDLARASDDPATRSAALAQIHQAARLMQCLVDDLLAQARLDADRLPPAPRQEVLDPAALMARVLGLAAGLPRHGAVALQARLDEAVPEAVLGEPQQLSQILLNLLANALRHTDHGRVQLGLRLHQPVEAAAPVLRWSVADTGIGMALADLDRIAQPFTQLGHDSSRHRGGSGLGLALVRQMLQRQGAALHWASMPGGGTLVWFDLPLRLATAETDPDTAVAVTTASARPPRPCTAVLRTDDRALAATLALRWRAAGQRLQPVGAGAWARLADVALGGIGSWLIDDRLPEPEQAAAAEAARRAGVALWRVHAEPADGRPRADARGTRRLQAALASPVDPTRGTPPQRPVAAPCGPAVHTGCGAAASAPVLVVEDDLLGQRMTAGLLAHLGLPCQVAGSLAEAARLARHCPPGLVLLDRQLPDGDGLQWLAAPRPAEAPVVVTSAHADPVAQAQARQAGALAVLPKPITLDGLRALLARVGLLPASGLDGPTTADDRRHPGDAPGAASAATPPHPPDLTPLFVQQRPALVAPIEAAWAAGDSGTLGRAVHALRGPLAWLPQASARSAARLARAVEEGLHQGRRPGELPVPELLRHTWAVQAGA